MAIYTKDKDNNLRKIKTARSAKDAGIHNIEDLIQGGLIDGLEDLCKTTDEDLKDASIAQGEVNELFPTGFKPYNEVWRYEPVTSDYFARVMLGEAFTTKQQETIDVLCGKDPFKFTDPNYEEIDAMWGKRSGKDSTIAKGLDFQCYKLCCLFNPQEYLGMGIGSSIDIINVASNSKQAKNVFFKYFKTFIALTKDPDLKRNWFANRNFWWDIGRKTFRYMDLREKEGDIKQDNVDFGRGITCHSLTSDRFTAEGLNIIIAVMDEIGAMRVEDVFGTEDKMIGQYDSLSATVRATSTKGMGKMLCISYKYGRNCPMSILVKKNRKESKKFVRVYSVYEVRSDKNEKELRATFSSEYNKDPEKAAMMYECKDPKVDSDNIYSNIFIIENAIDVAKKYSVNPTIGEVVTVNNIQQGVNAVLKDWFKANDDLFYTAHLDLAKGRVWKGQDAAGLAIGHLQEMRLSFDKLLIENYKREYGQDLSQIEGELRMGIVCDLALQIVCKPQDEEVYLSDVRKFLIDLNKLRHFEFFKITIDGWQSVESIQEFNRAGFEAELLSVDKDPAVHHTMKDFVQLGLFKIYPHKVWKREVKELIQDGNKIEHPEVSVERYELEGVEHGSKDVADATAGVCFNLSKEIEEGGEVFIG